MPPLATALRINPLPMKFHATQFRPLVKVMVLLLLFSILASVPGAAALAPNNVTVAFVNHFTGRPLWTVAANESFYAFRYGVELINQRSDILPNTTIVVDRYDTGGSLDGVVRTGFEISLTDAVASVGITLTNPTLLMARLLRVSSKPVLGHRAGGAELSSDEFINSNLFRMQPGLSQSLIATAKLLSQLELREVVVVRTQRHFDLDAVQLLIPLLADVGISIAAQVALRDDEFLTGSLLSLKEKGNRIFISLAWLVEDNYLLQAAYDVGLMGEGYFWLVPTRHTNSDYSQPQYQHLTENVVTFAWDNLDDAEQISILKDELLTNPLGDTDFNPEGDWDNLSVRLMLEAADTISMALHNAIEDGNDVLEEGVLLPYVRATNFESSIGHVGFDKVGERLSELQTVQYLNSTMFPVSSPLNISFKGGAVPVDYGIDTCKRDSFRNSTTLVCTQCPSRKVNLKGDGKESCTYCSVGTFFVTGGFCQPCGKDLVGKLDENGVPTCVNEKDEFAPTTLIAIFASAFGLLFLAFVMFFFYMRWKGMQRSSDLIKKEAERRMQFVAYVFHELRNPVNGIAGYLSFAQQGIKDFAEWAEENSSEESDPISLSLLSPTTVDDMSDLTGVEGNVTAMPKLAMPKMAMQKEISKIRLLPQLKEVLRDINGSAVCCRQTLDILNHVLDLAKLTEGKFRLVEVEFNLSQLLQTVKEVIHGVNSDIPVSVDLLCEKDIDETKLIVVGDELRLRQILINLVSNAVKFSDGSEVSIIVSVCHSIKVAGLNTSPSNFKLGPSQSSSSMALTASGGKLQRNSSELESKVQEGGDVEAGSFIEVEMDGFAATPQQSNTYDDGVNKQEKTSILHVAIRDRGCGISEGDQRLLFSPFEQLQSKKAGTGLGLALSHKLVSLMGGELKVRSPWSKGVSGSEFYFDIPVHASSGSSIDASISNEASSGVSAALSSPSMEHIREEKTSADSKPLALRVLIADDMRYNRRLLLRKFKSGKFVNCQVDLDEASSGEEVLEKLRGGQKFDIIVLDEIYSATGGLLSGSDVASRIRASERQGAMGDESVSRTIIVSSSGKALESDIERYHRIGFDCVWSKPVPSPDVMYSDIMKRLGLEPIE